jgi:hypothetical protein
VTRRSVVAAADPAERASASSPSASRGWHTHHAPDAAARKFWTIALGIALEGHATGRSAVVMSAAMRPMIRLWIACSKLEGEGNQFKGKVQDAVGGLKDTLRGK